MSLPDTVIDIRREETFGSEHCVAEGVCDPSPEDPFMWLLLLLHREHKVELKDADEAEEAGRARRRR